MFPTVFEANVYAMYYRSEFLTFLKTVMHLRYSDLTTSPGATRVTMCLSDHSRATAPDTSSFLKFWQALQRASRLDDLQAELLRRSNLINRGTRPRRLDACSGRKNLRKGFEKLRLAWFVEVRRMMISG
jgi:hypothetical protein